MKKLALFSLACAALAVIVGCNCNAAKTCSNSAMPTNTVKTAVTPEGEMLYVVGVWDAELVCPDSNAPCPTAQCWATTDGKTYCAKPLTDCPKQGKGCPAREHFKTSDGKVACPQQNAAVVTDGKSKNWCVKEVKACPKQGTKDCPAKEHVKMKDGAMGCAKADLAACPMMKGDAVKACPKKADDAAKAEDATKACPKKADDAAKATPKKETKSAQSNDTAMVEEVDSVVILPMQDEIEEDDLFVVSAI